MWNSINFQKKYFDDMIKMTIEYYGEENDISNFDFINHEYFNNPDGKAYIRLANDEQNNMLAGQYIVIPRSFLIDGTLYKSVLSLNTLTREAYRGQKVFVTLADQVYDDCKNDNVFFCYGAPNQNSFPGFIRKLKFTNMGEVPLYLKINRPSQLVYEKTGSRLLASVARMFNVLGIMPKVKKKDTLTIVAITNDNVNLMDEVWSNLKNKYKVMGERGKAYIQWRYLDMPIREYKIFLAEECGVPRGYIIGRITEVAGMQCGMVVDFLFEEENLEIGYALIRKLKVYFDGKKVGLIGCLMQKYVEEAKCLRKMGFFKCPKFLEPQPFPIIYRQFHDLTQKEQNVIKDFRNWFFTMGDYDVI